MLAHYNTIHARAPFRCPRRLRARARHLRKVVCDPSYLQNKVNTLYIQILEGLVISVPNTYILLDDKLIY
jgi:hypothetical protein